MEVKGIVDFTNCMRYSELFERIYKGLDLEDYNCGKNWDACWDAISSLSAVNSVIVKGKNSAATELQTYIDKFIGLLERFKSKCNTDYKEFGCTFDYRVID